jgi:RNA polymerase sigma-70 factor (ECF subfamily)
LPPANPESSRWFTEHLQPHEAILRAWLRGQFPQRSDLDDVIQESFMRVLAARQEQEITAPKSFLFATARNIVLGQVRHEKVVGNFALAESALIGIYEESADVAHEVARAQELELLTHAIQSLPTRCRQIITLRRIYGLSQKEVAAQLGLAEHTVEAQASIGLKKLTEYFAHFERPRPLGR